MKRAHIMPFGAELLAEGGVRFRLWAPSAERVELCLEGQGLSRTEPMNLQADGWCEFRSPEAGPGTRYCYRIDGGAKVPDPASRFQPDDIHGPSEVIDPAAFDWQDDSWRGRPWEETVLYELHVGTFTEQGTYDGLAQHLDHLVDLGVTAIELMPLSEAPGARNWGYDGVYPFAPERRYGRPEDLKRFVQLAHQRELSVFLDVVYNHFGPEGNYLNQYARQFFTERHHTPWGAAINFDGTDSRPVRDFFIHNALYWIEEFNFDGLRFDAVDRIIDDSDPDILSELAETVRAAIGDRRPVHLVLENAKNDAHRLERGADGQPRHYTAQWDDDIHHVYHVLVTDERGGYYADYTEQPIEQLGRALTEGFVFQGEVSPYHDNAPRGEPSGHLPPTAFVAFLQNHDQIGNRAFGERIGALAPSEAVDAAAAILLLAPAPPLLFMGEEWGAKEPFYFFCDFEPELGRLVREGRRNEFARFPHFSDPEVRERIPDPNALETFRASILTWADRESSPHRERLQLYRRLLRLRHDEIVPRLKGIGGDSGRFETFGDRGLLVEWRLGDKARLGLVANMGAEGASAPPRSPPGRLLFATDEQDPAGVAKGGLPPWSVAWFLADDQVRAAG
ncbi:malto-oligosyltrehalose trehalohydrolase [Rhodospirillaceae bacterium SYSU D60014]|uniref:malto-oligosyltrehalose trehalohydrolase n=1 Tax=Virgifigura deserti TaxID=2268457 RepID=UPI000E65FDAA